MAQEAFYLNMGLPVYVRTASSDSFAASVVEEGHALLFYNGTKLRAKLSSGNYVDAGGSSSTDFSVVTATVDDVLSPKRFYNSAGNLVTGNIQTVTATLDGDTVHIPRGYIAQSDSITVSGGGGDADVILGVIDANGHFQKLKFTGTDASNSGSAQSVSSYYTWNSTLPAPTPTPGGSTDFYKCSYVNSNSWGGYKAVLSAGVYTFQSDSTGGLIYSLITPIIGNCYNDGALIRAYLYDGMPAQGLIFYAPLSSVQQIAGTGQVLTTTGDVTYSTVNGIPCAYFAGSSYITFVDTGFPTGDFTLSLWFKGGEEYSYLAFSFGTPSPGEWFALQLNSTDITIDFYSASVSQAIQYSNTWHHLVFTCNSNYFNAYLDSTQIITDQYVSRSTVLNGTGYIGRSAFSTWSDRGFIGYLAGVRLYNRVLTSSQISALASQFTPTT